MECVFITCNSELMNKSILFVIMNSQLHLLDIHLLENFRLQLCFQRSGC